MLLQFLFFKLFNEPFLFLRIQSKQISNTIRNHYFQQQQKKIKIKMKAIIMTKLFFSFI